VYIQNIKALILVTKPSVYDKVEWLKINLTLQTKVKLTVTPFFYETFRRVFVFFKAMIYIFVCFRAIKMSNYLMVAAIDFGTIYSGYAFSTISNFKLDHLKIHASQPWNAGGVQLLSLKTPTCLLLDGRKEIVSFGYEAEDAYTELVLEEKHHDHYYFSPFKMRLYNDKVIFLSFLTKKNVF